MQQAKLPLDADPLDDREKLLERFAGYRFVTLSDVLTIDLGQVLLAHEGRKNEPRDRVVRPGAFLQGGNQVDLKPRSITFASGFGLRVCCARCSWQVVCVPMLSVLNAAGLRVYESRLRLP